MNVPQDNPGFEVQGYFLLTSLQTINISQNLTL